LEQKKPPHISLKIRKNFVSSYARMVGNWGQNRHPRMHLPVEMPYFRKLEDGAPAAGSFSAWPDNLADF
jgi:hypothetical protein